MGELIDPSMDPRPYYDSSDARTFILDEIRELIQYRYLIFNLIRTNITARYKRSVLGVIWTLLDPLLTMTVMAIVFSALFNRQVPGFPVFLFSGIVIWQLFSEGSSKAISDLVFGGGVLGRVYMPKSVYSVAATGTSLINFLLSLIPLALFVAVFNRPITLAMLFVPVSILITSVFTLGVGLVVSSLAVFFSDIMNVHNILLRLLLYLSGVFFEISFLPEELGKLVNLIPTYHMIELFRQPVYNGRLPSLTSIAYMSLWAVLMFLVGFWVFSKLSDEYTYRV